MARGGAASEEDFTTQMQDARQRLAELEAHIDETRSNAEKMNDESMRENRRLVEDAERQAASIVGEARAQVARIRADSDRELAAASQRRDSINAQLTNVRQMLATLTGGVALPMVDPFEESDQPQAVEQAEESEHAELVEVETQDETDEQGTQD